MTSDDLTTADTGPGTVTGTDASLPSATEPELLLDRYLPRFDVTVHEHAVVDADPVTTWRALQELDLMQVHTPLLDAAMYARGLPATLASRLGRRPAPPAPPPRLRLVGEDASALPGWLSLGTVPGHEAAFGAVGRFWRPDIEWYDVEGMTPDQFAAFATPGWGRIASGLSLRPYGRSRTLVTYEARTAVSDPASARRFATYWVVVRPFAAHVLRATLEALRQKATASALSPAPSNGTPDRTP